MEGVMGSMMGTFHFLRPSWLLALIALLPISLMVWHRRGAANEWRRICDPHLLRHLVADGSSTRSTGPAWLLGLGVMATCLALAGPTWERLPQASFASPSRTVFVLGLAPSMNATDVAPSRVARARHKLMDAVELAKDGAVGLVVYREEAFAATPLTDDAQVLRELLPVLETELAPGRGVLPARGLDEARRLLEPVGVRGARVLLVTDGSDDDPAATERAAATLASAGAHLSVLGIAGDSAQLRSLARIGGGRFASLRADDGDLGQLLQTESIELGTPLDRTDIATDVWRDMGVWLVWVPLLLAPFAFRKGWATAIALLFFLPLGSSPADASVRDWFERPDQQAARQFAKGEFEGSARSFEDPDWKAAAAYRAGEFEQAADLLADRTDSESQYNRANALARAGRLEESLALYDRVLASNGAHADATFNRDLVKQLLDAQTPPPDSSQQDSSQQDSSRQNAARQDASQQGGDPGESSGQDQTNDRGQKAQGDDANADRGTSNNSSPQGQDDTSGTPAASPADDQSAANGADAADDASPGSSSEEARDEAQATGAPAANESPGGKESSQAASDQGASARDSGSGQVGASPPQMAGASDAGEQPAEAAAPDGSPGSPGGSALADSRDGPPVAQWMARLPDDPGGLLREKIRRDYVRKIEARRQGEL